MKIAVGGDHGGFEAKVCVIQYLKDNGYEVADYGTFSKDSCHYPTYALAVAEAVQQKKADKGIVICTSGEGVSIMANKVKGVRCGIAYNDDTARLIVEHNNCNVVSLGANFFSKEQLVKMVDIFLHTEFAGGRHQIRVDLITDYENKHIK